MVGIATKIQNAMKVSGLNARNLAAMSHIHYSTVYSIIRRGDSARTHATVVVAIERALDTIDKLVLEGKLPLPLDLSQEAKQAQLAWLIEQQNDNE